MTVRRSAAVRDGFQYLEGARWHDGALWFSDIPQGKVYRMSPEGELDVVASGQPHPSGLGFAPDGTVLVVGMENRELLRIQADGSSEKAADLSEVSFSPNDMWVDSTGRAYISQLGYDVFGGAEPQGTHVLVADPDGSVSTAGTGLVCPNGIGLTPDGRTLIVVESFAQRISAFAVDSQGRLSDQRVFAQFEQTEANVMDGLCVDSAGAVWVACPFAGEVRRILDGGEITDRVKVETDGHMAIACALGGPDLRTLYVCAADITFEQMADDFNGKARIEAATVDIPGMAH
ncbi:MAG: SMP-30/gluconolactonase/LRE family protein [Nocardiopsaceae bacterium]|mgnify:CR=1 FL=1|nr:SMP-30/gluconolactonase/LRE family protein [Nocardiopsaceae bacterium]